MRVMLFIYEVENWTTCTICAMLYVHIHFNFSLCSDVLSTITMCCILNHMRGGRNGVKPLWKYDLKVNFK